MRMHYFYNKGIIHQNIYAKKVPCHERKGGAAFNRMQATAWGTLAL